MKLSELPYTRIPEIPKWISDPTVYASRDERMATLFLDRNEIDYDYNKHVIKGGDDKWSVDISIRGLHPEYITHCEIKPKAFWYETRRIKPIIYHAIARGDRFLVMFIYMNRSVPIVAEMTACRESDFPERQMVLFSVVNRPLADFIPKSRAMGDQLRLFEPD